MKTSKAYEMMKDIQTSILSGITLITIRTLDEQRVIAALAEIAKSLDLGLRLWSSTFGFMSANGENVEQATEPDQALEGCLDWNSGCLFMLRDFHSYLDASIPVNAMLIRKIRDYMRLLRQGTERKCMVLTVPPGFKMPETLVEGKVVDWGLPDKEEIGQALNACLEERPDVEMDVEQKATVTQSALGLTMQQIENAFAESLIRDKTLAPSVISLCKRKMIEACGFIKWLDWSASMAVVGGLDRLKLWVNDAKECFSVEAQEYGLERPKGVLVTGVAGCGKSLTAKCTAGVFGVPSLFVDMSLLFGGIVGETEKNVALLTQTLDAIGPCVVVLEEIEKALGGSTGDSSSDGGVAKRMLGTLLTYMQESDAGTFWFATSNDISSLPPELKRAGRFDATFFVDLPNDAERAEIFGIHISKRKRNPADFDLDHLAQKSEGYSGAEIEGCVKDALIASFKDGKREPRTEDFLQALERKVPMSKSSKPQIDKMRAEMKGKAVWATSEQAAKLKGRYATL